MEIHCLTLYGSARFSATPPCGRHQCYHPSASPSRPYAHQRAAPACRPAGCQPRKPSRWPHYLWREETTQSHSLSRTKERFWLQCVMSCS
ncbi:unnamed protein product [Pleuronectes platessa]|uniref:Uncharacterized protein n=1 Tax=Pleuronectes platessa TaxID=8262 RepID=A0A9N7U5U6_PLEPL|nr:unnamed protein product [Pleuronectes platessa]